MQTAARWVIAMNRGNRGTLTRDITKHGCSAEQDHLNREWGDKVKPRPVGRPPRAAKASLERITIRATKTERRRWERLAGKLSLSEWMRALANEAAERVLGAERGQAKD